ncbi:ferritin-like protein [Photobacterium sp. CCB-ST2H9]|uniref:ferritin-like domain-containing protein n=1 Tax=Photobacterium sp. CCB-ST2H9 TaxID=2912855 RepID=UPI00200467FD|nr:ferritin-like protein [Photobacterium sp. CCB-ST2H9]UTM59890.1 ferritin-like protein [Photobacterium sp. CCB-ST2H9]
MLKLKKEVVEKIRGITNVVELHHYLQSAIELEHATIPVYLTGLFSLKQAQNVEAGNLVRSVVIEEMLHMSIACNVLNAIGGQPQINKPGFVPTFPGPLPMGVGEDRGLIATLAPLTKEQVKTVFMAIEEPANPIDIPVEKLMLAADPSYTTIGEFYQAIIDKIQQLGDGIFTGDPSRQLADTKWFPSNELWAVTDVESACSALQLIVDQGEGSSKSPVDEEGELAHYYRFAEIYYGKRLVRDAGSPVGWSFSGAPVPLNPDDVYNLKPSAKAEDYPAGSVARRYADQTNYTYSSLLNSLHHTFNGEPQQLDHAMGLMYELRLSVQKMVTIDLGNGVYAAPPFQYVATNV